MYFCRYLKNYWINVKLNDEFSGLGQRNNNYMETGFPISIYKIINCFIEYMRNIFDKTLYKLK